MSNENEIYIGNKVEILELQDRITVARVVWISDSGKLAEVKPIEDREICTGYAGKMPETLETPVIKTYGDDAKKEVIRLRKNGTWWVSETNRGDWHCSVVVNRTYGKDYYLDTTLGCKYVEL